MPVTSESIYRQINEQLTSHPRLSISSVADNLHLSRRVIDATLQGAVGVSFRRFQMAKTVEQARALMVGNPGQP
jgi:hypothetical protein